MDKKECNINFFNRWASSYDCFLFQFWMKRFHKPVFEELNSSFKKDLSLKYKLIDLSLGSGELLKELSKRYSNKLEFYGIDIAEKMLEVARKKLSNNIKLQLMDVHKLEFQDNYFDYVISTEAFHHYYDQRKALVEMKRIMKIGGKVIIVDINFLFDFLHRFFERNEPGCIKVNNKEEMFNLLKEAGFKEIKQKRNFLFSVATMGVK